jgi:phosphoserine phosphatase RsbU/P
MIKRRSAGSSSTSTGRSQLRVMTTARVVHERSNCSLSAHSCSRSGDLFEVLELSDTKARIFICDVMDHGVRVALVSSTVSALVGQLRDYLENPGEFLCRLNRALRSRLEYYSEAPLFASAFYLLPDLEKGKLRYANAGHPNPLRLHREGDHTDTYSLNGSKHGLALGLFDDAVYPTGHCDLSPHDTLLLFTDGLYEVRVLAEASTTIGAC